MTLTNEQKNNLRSSVATLRSHGKELTTKFYETLFKEQPEFRNFFNETNLKTGKQPAALAETVFRFVENLDNLDVMMPQMSRLSSKHRAVGVRPELYPVLGKYLLQTIKETLGNQGTPEVMASWQAVYDLMSQTFIKREKELYEQLGSDERDRGFVPFTVVKKETVASGPTVCVTLQRADGGKLWKSSTGQYITVRIEKNGIQHQGHYVLLEPFNGNTYSIAFKERNEADQNTIVSDEIIRNRPVGSTLLVSAPAGSFGLDSNAKRHLFLGGGIGITSLMGMIEDLNQQGKAASVTVVHCVRKEEFAAFADKLRNMLPQGQYVVLTEKDPLSKSHLDGKVQSDTHVYISGSENFIGMGEKAIAGFNLPRSQVHIKSIEPTLGLLNAIDRK